VHVVGMAFRSVEVDRWNALGSGESARGRNVLDRGGRCGGIDCVDVEILVAALVLHIQDVLAVPTPEILRDRSLDVVGYELCGCVRIAEPLYPNVASVLVWLEEGDVASVGRDLRTGDLRIAEEELEVEKGWHFPCLGGSDGGRSEGDRESDRPTRNSCTHLFLYR